MKNFQVRLSDDLYNKLVKAAELREETIAAALRRALEAQLEDS